MPAYTITYWTGETKVVEAESLEGLYNKIWRGDFMPASELMLDENDPTIGHVFNEWGDHCAKIAKV